MMCSWRLFFLEVLCFFVPVDRVLLPRQQDEHNELPQNVFSANTLGQEKKGFQEKIKTVQILSGSENQIPNQSFLGKSKNQPKSIFFFPDLKNPSKFNR